MTDSLPGEELKAIPSGKISPSLHLGPATYSSEVKIETGYGL